MVRTITFIIDTVVCNTTVARRLSAPTPSGIRAAAGTVTAMSDTRTQPLVSGIDAGPVIGPLTADAGTVVALIETAIRATYPEEIAGRFAEKTVAGGRIERLLDERAWFAATVAGHLVGVAAVHLRDADTAYLSCHFVALRRMGIGAALTAARLEWAAAAGARHVEATTHPWNTASLTNLENNGFVIVDTGPDQWIGDGEIVTLSAPVGPAARHR